MTDRVLQTACCCLARSERLLRSAEHTRETLENQAGSRENGGVIAGQDWINGRQAARLL